MRSSGLEDLERLNTFLCWGTVLPLARSAPRGSWVECQKESAETRSLKFYPLCSSGIILYIIIRLCRFSAFSFCYFGALVSAPGTSPLHGHCEAWCFSQLMAQVHGEKQSWHFGLLQFGIVNFIQKQIIKIKFTNKSK